MLHGGDGRASLSLVHRNYMDKQTNMDERLRN